MRDNEKNTKAELIESVEEEEIREIGAVREKLENKGLENGENGPEDQIDIMKELEAAKQEAGENYDRFLRAVAELDNYKKRMTREMDGLRKFATESIIKQLLPVVDSLERAIESEKTTNGSEKPPEESYKGLVKGVGMTLSEILKIFEKFGVQPLRSVGETFNPQFHEAIMQEETEDGPHNIVLREYHKGYMMHDRLLRPAMVVVSKPKTGPGHNTGEDAESEPSENANF